MPASRKKRTSRISNPSIDYRVPLPRLRCPTDFAGEEKTGSFRILQPLILGRVSSACAVRANGLAPHISRINKLENLNVSFSNG